MDFGNTTWVIAIQISLTCFRYSKNASRSLWWENMVQQTLYHISLASRMRMLDGVPPFFIHVITLGSGSIKDPQKMYGCRVILTPVSSGNLTMAGQFTKAE